MVALALMVTACASPTSSSAVAGPSRTVNHSVAPAIGIYLGPSTAPLDYKAAGIATIPPGSLTPAIAWQTAYDNCATGAAVCLDGVDPTITLVLATSPDAGTALPDGSIDSLMKNTLVYVMKWTNEPCIPKGGPPRGPGQVAVAPTPRPCTLLSFVDANSGKVLYGVEGPLVGS